MTNKEAKEKLAYAYRILGHLGMADHTYTHLSARDPNRQDCFYIYPFGLLFHEVQPDNLLLVSLDGKILEGSEKTYNKTGYAIHGAIYKARPDIQSIFHVHTTAMVAVASIKEGLLPLSQWALHFYNRVAYQPYDSLIVTPEQGQDLTNNLGPFYTMLLQNHGGLTCGRTIEEALFYTYHLEQACRAQCATLAMNRPLVIPSKEMCEEASACLLSFEKNLGERDWEAWVRLMDQMDKS